MLKKLPIFLFFIAHSQREAYMDLVENGGSGGRRQQVQEPQGML